MSGKKKWFSQGVAYYPDYLEEGQLARLASGEIKALSVAERIRVDFARMQASGIDQVRIGEFSWAHVEPEPGQLHLGRFLDCLDVAAASGLRVMCCTPTATPPKWLVDRHPELLPVTRDGRVMPWGGRRHYDPTSQIYRAESRRITEVYAQAFGQHPAVYAWQTDNEMANHGSARCFTEAVKQAFHIWLNELYAGDVQRLNRDWFTCFWSQHYRSFAEIELPLSTWSEANPGLELAYRRFMTTAYRDFQNDQIDILRRLSPGRLITHNITPMLFDVCWWQLCQDLDVAGYDHYQMQALPDPLASAGQFNFMRSLKGGRKFLVLEQQPVQVNWQQINGRWGIDWLFLWGMQAACLGAEAMLYFSWQRFYGGTEAYHDGIVPHDLRVPESRQERVLKAKSQVFSQLTEHFQLTELPPPQTEVAIVFSTESFWAHEISSQTTLWNGVSLIDELQRPFLQHGIGVDMVPTVAAGLTPAGRYKLLILPGYAFALSAEERQLLIDFMAAGGSVWSLPRTAVKERSGRMLELPLQLFAADDFYLDDGGALLEHERESLAWSSGEGSFSGKIWAEKWVVQNPRRWQTLATFQGGLFHGAPAVLRAQSASGSGCYVHFASYPELTADLVTTVLKLFHLEPKLAAAFAAPVQTYTFQTEQGELFGAVNFGFNDERLQLPMGPAAVAVHSFTAGLDERLAVRSQLQSRKLQGQGKGREQVLLPGRSVGFWRVERP